jgi:pimeloyl-ACP methyl ester carboxylesterase
MQETSAVHPPDVNYARSGEVAIAYQVVGEGPTDVVFVRGITGDLLSTWEQPLLVRHVEGLADCGRVLMLDKRGTGLSDRVREVQSLETTMDDIRAVMDAAASESAVLWMGGNSTGIGLLFAATYPERCAGLVLFDPRVKGFPSPTTRGLRPKRNGGNDSRRCAPGGESEATSRTSPASGRRRLPPTTASLIGSCGICGAVSVRALHLPRSALRWSST